MSAFPSNGDYAMLGYENALRAWHAKEHPGCDFWSLSSVFTEDGETRRCADCGKEWSFPVTPEQRAESARLDAALDYAIKATDRAMDRMGERILRSMLEEPRA